MSGLNPLDLERDVIPYLRRMRLAKAWGSVTIHFKAGEPTGIEPRPMIATPEDLRRHLPRLPEELPGRAAV